MKTYFIKNSRSSGLDEHGQPVNRNFNRARLTDRNIDELIGICKGIVVDQMVTTEEASFLTQWLKINENVIDEWPANIIAARIEEMLIDTVIDEKERKELFDLLQEFTGEKEAKKVCDNYSTSLPFDRPFPELVFPNNIFCLTGKFCFGARGICESEIMKREGLIQSNPTLKTNYLVIGILGSSDWIHTTHGRKIEKAVEYREKGRPIKIIPEEHWANALIKDILKKNKSFLDSIDKIDKQ
jgi:NAD-dependent DNA ligase